MCKLLHTWKKNSAIQVTDPEWKNAMGCTTAQGKTLCSFVGRLLNPVLKILAVHSRAAVSSLIHPSIPCSNPRYAPINSPIPFCAKAVVDPETAETAAPFGIPLEPANKSSLINSLFSWQRNVSAAASCPLWNCRGIHARPGFALSFAAGCERRGFGEDWWLWRVLNRDDCIRYSAS